MAQIELNNITFTYPETETPALKNLSLQIEKGQFVVLFGASGSGKSTLLRLLKKEIRPHGELKGDIIINGRSRQESDAGANEIGFVFQDPENQVVAENVLQEIVFGLENMGLSTTEMRSRVAEMVHFFGAESLLDRKTHELSGGKKQQINLASVLLMQPNILLLDEPTAQLDPVSARELLDMLVRLNDEFGMTIVVAEHRLEELFTVSDKIVMMEQGKITHEGAPKQMMEMLWNSSNRVYVPSIPSLYLSIEKNENRKNPPLTVKEGKRWFQQNALIDLSTSDSSVVADAKEELIRAKNLAFLYSKDDEMVLKELDFSIQKGETYALLGGNGSGKSTLLKLIGGILKPSQGKVFFHEKPLKTWSKNDLIKKIGYLPQNPKIFFIQDTVEKEINETLKQWGITDFFEVERLLNLLGIAHLRNQHPYDLSGGELQKAALACLLIRNPEVLLLDEPTKGLDPVSKANLAEILKGLQEGGTTILMSTHDVEFAAQHATKCGMMFQGKITSEGSPSEFFKGNFFYTTMIQRLFRHIPESQIMTLEEAVSACKTKVH
ncbi:ABC transporter ATP-binding protein [Bacillus sp. 1NLA3E]|uniref:ABC transporter ATP-binding protein n=1 Tax=Bacillus sp. 1NLA3E TaxID=666686 RepID=UPI000247E8C5|nr:ABC transporter ATP-binding protein [Bacillus sp. 1NLA3E]AGK52638.1 ABC transporter [Bacillus sp. 1NLA3E]